MSRMTELRERRNAIAKALRNIVDQHQNSWGDAQAQEFDAQERELSILDGQIDRMQKVLDAEAAERTPRLDDKLENLDQLSPKAILNTYLRKGESGLSAEQLQRIRNTMSTTTTTEGGFTVAKEVARDIVDTLKDYSWMRAVAGRLVTSAGNPMDWPGTDGTAEIGELLAENASSTNADIAFTARTLNTFKYSSKDIAVPIELLQDSEVDLEMLIRQRMIDRIGRITNQHFTTGSGSGQPTGIVTAASTGVTLPTGNTLTYTYDGLVDLVDSIDAAYLRGPCAFMISQTGRRALRKVKDSQNRPLWLPSYDAGMSRLEAETLMGYPVALNNDLAVPAANAKSMTFGDHTRYMVRDALDVLIYRMTDSAYAKKGQIGYLAIMRSGGNLIDLAAVKVLVHSAT